MDAVGFHDIEECFLANSPSFSKELVLRIRSGGGGGCSRSCDFGGFGGGGNAWWYGGAGTGFVDDFQNKSYVKEEDMR